MSALSWQAGQWSTCGSAQQVNIHRCRWGQEKGGLGGMGVVFRGLQGSGGMGWEPC